MSFFDGNFRQKRPQVFDRSEKLTREAILKKVLDRRQEHDLNSRRNKAVLKLQSFVRGIISRAKLLEITTRNIDDLTGFLKRFSQNRQDVDSLSKSELTGVDNKLVRVLRLLSWRNRQKPDRNYLFIACSLLLSHLGQICTAAWLSQEPADRVHTLGRFLVILVRYLADLPPQSPTSDYFVPVRVLESLLPDHSGGEGEPPQSGGTATQRRTHLTWLNIYLTKNHYFRHMCRFIQGNIPPTAGYLSAEDGTSSATFDPVEFAKPVRTQALLALLRRPISWCLPSSSDSQEQASKANQQLCELVTMALNDILLPASSSDWYTPNERIVRGMAGHLLDCVPPLPVLHHLCSALLSPPDSTTASTTAGASATGGKNSLTGQQPPVFPLPSLNLLYLLVNVVAPRFIKIKSAVGPLQHLPISSSEEKEGHRSAGSSDGAEADDAQPDHTLFPVSVHLRSAGAGSALAAGGLEAALLVRCTADLLVRAMFSPRLPCAHQLVTVKPLLRPDEDPVDSSDDEEGVTGDRTASRRRYAEFKSLWSQPTWKSQTEELFTGLQHCLPTLASGALSLLNRVDSAAPTFGSSPGGGWLTSAQRHLVISLAQLHYIFAQIFRRTSTAMIELNSAYSKNPIYIRALWHTIQYPSGTPAGFDSTNSSLFTRLATGELPKDVTSLQAYLPLIFTFTDCLLQRLLCLTDIEIANGMQSPGSLFFCSQQEGFAFGCGFTGDELLSIGLRLRDLLIGIITVAHPHHLSRPSPSDTQPSDWFNTQLGPSWTDVCQAANSASQPSFSELLESMEQRESLGASAAHATSTSRNLYGWSPIELRLQLHCWRSLFRHVQCLVLQIYYWHRRTDRQTTAGLPAPAGLPRTSEAMDTDYYEEYPGQLSHPVTGVWMKPSLTTSILSSLNSLLERSKQDVSSLASARFGYYSRLNPDVAESVVFAPTPRWVCDLLLMKEVPFVIPLSQRIRLFRLLVTPTQGRGRNRGWLDEHIPFGNISIVVRRSHLYEDAFEKLSKENEPDLKSRIRIGFINAAGVEEMGVDGGGLSREFLADLLLTGFNPNRGLFVCTAEQTLYPNPSAAHLFPDYQKHYYFLGRMLAKAIYEEVQVELRFAHFFLTKLVSRAGAAVGFDYLQSLDPELYRQLNKLKSYKGNVGDLALDFTIVQSSFGQSETMELKPGGQNIPVTNENRVEYMHLVAHYKLNRQIHPQVRAFLAGVNDVISASWLCLFDAEEMQLLISGSNKIDIDDLRQHTNYFRDPARHSETLDHFWHVLSDLSEDDKHLFLHFVTSRSTPPMFGFRYLEPTFTVQVTDELDRLPTASTCSNLLRLPDYKDARVLREKLLLAIRAHAGFEYS